MRGAARFSCRSELWSGTRIVPVGGCDQNEGTIATSTDGPAWMQAASGTSYVLNGVAQSPKTLVMVGGGGTIITSP